MAPMERAEFERLRRISMQFRLSQSLRTAEGSRRILPPPSPPPGIKSPAPAARELVVVRWGMDDVGWWWWRWRRICTCASSHGLSSECALSPKLLARSASLFVLHDDDGISIPHSPWAPGAGEYLRGRKWREWVLVGLFLGRGGRGRTGISYGRLTCMRRAQWAPRAWCAPVSGGFGSTLDRPATDSLSSLFCCFLYFAIDIKLIAETRKRSAF
jgi:hypothetical protein